MDDSGYSRYYPEAMLQAGDRSDTGTLQPQYAMVCRWLFGSSLAGLLAVLFPPLALACGYPKAAALGYFFFSPICHQLPDRAWHLLGHPLALCARCTGLAVGVALGFSLGCILHQEGRPAIPTRRWLLLSMLLMAADVIAPGIGAYQNTLITRSLTGLFFGCLAAPYLTSGCTELAALTAGQAPGEVAGKREYRGEMTL